ncbi:MAG: hypothetical protein ABIE84_04945 [bacterium]
MDTPKWVRPLFIFSALYDGVLAILFLLISGQVYSYFNIALPNHMGYLQWPALMLLIFTVMFVEIALDPKGKRNLIFYGILLKISFCSVVFPHWLMGNIPSMWVPFAFCDLAFLIVYVYTFKILKS